MSARLAMELSPRLVNGKEPLKASRCSNASLKSLNLSSAQKQIQSAQLRLEQCKPILLELKEEAASVVLSLQARLKQTHETCEDVMGELIALDDLVGLAPQDRTNKKAAIAGVDSLLADVEAFTTGLTSLKTIFQTTNESAAARQQHHQQLQQRKESLEKGGVERHTPSLEEQVLPGSTGSAYDNACEQEPLVLDGSANVQIQNVLRRIELCTPMVKELQRDVSQFVNRSLSSPTEKALEKGLELRAVEALKQARALGEDLMSDLLALDNLVALPPEQRSNRKTAVSSLDALLEDVDTCKVNIGKLQTALQSARETVCCSEDAIPLPPPPAKIRKHNECESPTSRAHRVELNKSGAPNLQIQSVLQRIKLCRPAVRDLKEKVSYFVSQTPSSSKDSEKRASEALKQARNLGEDLMADLLALDSVDRAALGQQERSDRKAAIAGIDSLLEDLDACKGSLASLQTALQSARAPACPERA